MIRRQSRPVAAFLALPLTLALLFAISTAAQASTGYTGSSTGQRPQVSWYTDYLSMGCDSMTIAGERDAAGMPATLASSNWQDCMMQLGLQTEVTQTGTWSFAPAATVGSVTTGVLQGVDFVLVATDPATGLPDPTLCSFTVQGDALAAYDSSADQLAITHSQADASSTPNPLTVTSVSGCGGVVLAGDAFYLESILQLT